MERFEPKEIIQIECCVSEEDAVRNVLYETGVHNIGVSQVRALSADGQGFNYYDYINIQTTGWPEERELIQCAFGQTDLKPQVSVVGEVHFDG